MIPLAYDGFRLTDRWKVILFLVVVVLIYDLLDDLITAYGNRQKDDEEES